MLLPRLLALTRDRHREVIGPALVALAQLELPRGDERRQAVVRAVLGSFEDPVVVRASMEAVRLLGREAKQALPHLVREIRRAPEQSQVRTAIRALAAFGEDAAPAVGVLVQLLENDDWKSCRADSGSWSLSTRGIMLRALHGDAYCLGLDALPMSRARLFSD